MPRLGKMYDTGPVTELDGGWFILNPDSTLPIAVSGIDQAAAEKLKRGLEKGYALHSEAEAAIFGMLSRSTTFRCREIEAYERDFSAPFMAAWQQMREQAPEWEELVAKGDAAKHRRERLSTQVHRALVDEWGEAFRNAAAVVSSDKRERILAVTELLVLTYIAGGRAKYKRAQRLDPDLLGTEIGWTLMRMPAGCCHICRARSTDYPPEQYPDVPLHAGCMCSVHVKLRG